MENVYFYFNIEGYLKGDMSYPILVIQILENGEKHVLWVQGKPLKVIKFYALEGP